MRRRDPQVRVVSAPFDVDEAIARALADAPSMPCVRVITIGGDGTITSRDARISDFTDGEETVPS